MARPIEVEFGIVADSGVRCCRQFLARDCLLFNGEFVTETSRVAKVQDELLVSDRLLIINVFVTAIVAKTQDHSVFLLRCFSK